MSFTFKHGDRPLEGYEIKRALGRGGFGEVYYAVSDGGREVALKYLHSNEDIELRGISHCINMKSPHLVSIFDVIKNPAGEYFVVMEHVSGPSLRDLLVAEPQGIGVQKAAFFLKGIAEGLSYLHDRGIVHRDLKPGNIFYEEGYVKIGDYGLSKFISQSAAGGNTASIGTVSYMAPEVGSGNYSKSIDIYALGVMLYEMLLGRVPFEGQSTGEVLMRHLMDQPEVDALPQPFAKVIRKALSKDPNERYKNVSEIVDEIYETAAVRDSVASFDADSLTHIAARVAEDVRLGQLPTMAMPKGETVGGSSAQHAPAVVPPAIRVEQDKGLKSAQFAGFWIRFVAALLDVVIIAIPGSIAIPIGQPILGLVYAVVLLTYWNGQTVGKFACGIRVVDAYGRPLTLGRAIGRELSKYISAAIMFIGYVMAGFTFRKQALHDMIAQTYVIYAQQSFVDSPSGVPQAQGTGDDQILRDERLKRRQQIELEETMAKN